MGNIQKCHQSTFSQEVHTKLVMNGHLDEHHGWYKFNFLYYLIEIEQSNNARFEQCEIPTMDGHSSGSCGVDELSQFQSG